MCVNAVARAITRGAWCNEEIRIADDEKMQAYLRMLYIKRLSNEKRIIL